MLRLSQTYKFHFQALDLPTRNFRTSNNQLDMHDSHRKTNPQNRTQPASKPASQVPSPSFTPSALINSSFPISLANIPGVFPSKSPISLSAPCSSNHSPTSRCPFAVATNSVDSDALWNRRFCTKKPTSGRRSSLKSPPRSIRSLRTSRRPFSAAVRMAPG